MSSFLSFSQASELVKQSTKTQIAKIIETPETAGSSAEIQEGVPPLPCDIMNIIMTERFKLMKEDKEPEKIKIINSLRYFGYSGDIGLTYQQYEEEKALLPSKIYNSELYADKFSHSWEWLLTYLTNKNLSELLEGGYLIEVFDKITISGQLVDCSVRVMDLTKLDFKQAQQFNKIIRLFVEIEDIFIESDESDDYFLDYEGEFNPFLSCRDDEIEYGNLEYSLTMGECSKKIYDALTEEAVNWGAARYRDAETQNISELLDFMKAMAKVDCDFDMEKVSIVYSELFGETIEEADYELGYEKLISAFTKFLTTDTDFDIDNWSI